MRRALMAGAALFALATAAQVATAQGGQGRRGFGGQFGGGGGLGLLRVAEVQKELKMTQPQIDKIEGKQQEVQQAMQEVFQGLGQGGFQNMTPEERAKLQARIQEINGKAVNDILDTTQQKRFRQLELQRAGGNAFARADVATELKLTADQKSKIQTIQQEQQQAMREAFQGGGQGASPEERQQMMAKIQELQKASAAKMEAVLTDAQKAQWKTMLGEPFKFPPMGFGGRRPGGNPPA